MKQIQFSVLFLITAILPGVHGASGQAINATMQNVSSRVATARSVPAAKPIANAPPSPRIAPRLATSNTRIIHSSAPRIAAQPPVLPQRPFSPPMQPSNPNFAVEPAQQGGSGQQAIRLDPVTRQTELRTLAEMRQQRGLVTNPTKRLDAATRETELRTLTTMSERREFGAQNQTLAVINPERRVTPENPAAAPRPETLESPKEAHPKKSHHKKDNIGYDEAFRRHWHESHDRNWWHNHCDTIVFVTTGFYFLDGSYWYPAWGYDPLQSYYDYDGPIYTYSDLLPDEVIANVQTALQDAGYYVGAITGSLSIDTRAALANFQRDYGLPITGAIDEATVGALGLY
jgi:hypothetical protein